ncbi:signal peptidase I [Natronosporangium hydrolyticum]|uniref:Signal peptidase I n=1 Tax=Natronosporangium hydrolyticum TaxID=2811111 RepID=A0A895YQ62_9ACTN|nr:signal peptidase I [Natronosporangium hydrolyticum]
MPEQAGPEPARTREARRGSDPRSPRRRPGDGRGAGSGAAPRPRKRRGLPLWQELPLLLVIALCLAVLVRTFLLQAFYIPSGSMEETLVAGDRVLVNKVVYHFREPARGEVVVFQGTDAWEPIGGQDDDIGLFARGSRAIGDLVGVTRPGASDYIKRVIGLPGDTVSCCDVDGRVFVNGQPLNEEYVIRDSPLDDVPLGDCRGRRFDEVVVQPGHMFVMGDHRQVSQDSRCQGQIPLDNVIGRAFIIVWPSDRWTGLSQPDTFGAAPAALGTTTEPSPAAADAGAGAQPAAQALGVAGLLGASMPVFRRSFRGDSPSLRRRVRPIRRRLAA